MAIRLLEGVYGFAAGTIVRDLPNNAEVRLVSAGKASWSLTNGIEATRATLPSLSTSFEREFFLYGPTYTNEGFAHANKDYARRKAGLWDIPSGMLWLSDTLSGINLYRYGLNLNPTIFYDPDAQGSSETGTYRNPYTALATLTKRCFGDMTGQALGVKRGSISRGSVNAANDTGVLNIAGAWATADKPFFIVPYGDNENLPIFSGSTLRQSWVAMSGNVIKHVVPAKAVDVFEDGVRLKAVSPGANEAAAIAAVQAAGPGYFAYLSSAVYVYPRDSAVSPNLGQFETNDVDYGITARYTDRANTGNIIIAGMHAKTTNTTNIKIGNLSGATNAPTGCMIVGCRAEYAGTDFGSSQAADNILIYGASDTARMTNGYIAGNYGRGALNNTVEIGAWDGGVIEKNLGTQAGGNCIAELWYSCSNVTTKFNRGYGDTYAGSRLVTSFHKSGYWVPGWTTAAGTGADATKNTGNVFAFNYIQDVRNFAIDIGVAQNTNIFNNTHVNQNMGSIAVTTVKFAGGATATGNTYNNNLTYDNVTTAHFPVVVDHALNMAAISGDNNSYVMVANPSNRSWRYNGSGGGTTSIATWRTLSSMDANSKTTCTGFALAAASPFLGDSTGYTLTASDCQGAGGSIASYGITADIDGRVFNTAAPNIGCWQG